MQAASVFKLSRPEAMLVASCLLLEVLEFIFPTFPDDPWWLWFTFDYLESVVLLVIIFSFGTLRGTIKMSLSRPWSRHEGLGLGLIRLFAIVAGLCIADAVIGFAREWSYSFLPDIRTNYPPDFDMRGMIWLDLTVGLSLVAFSEEFAFRAVALSALAKRNLSNGMIITISSILFGLVHLSSGLPNTFATMATGAVFMFTYIKTKSLWPMIIAHYLINFWTFSNWWQV